MEFESFNEGTLLYRIPAGETAPVDSLLAIIGKKERIFRHYFQENQQRQLQQTQQNLLQRQ
jgi:hypothetical protein